MNKNLYLLLLGTLMSAACTNNLEDINIDPSNKTAISFVGQNNMTRAGFTADTQIAMHIRSTKDASNIRETRTFANALTDDNPTTTSFSTIEAPSDENVRYWDDALKRGLLTAILRSLIQFKILNSLIIHTPAQRILLKHGTQKNCQKRLHGQCQLTRLLRQSQMRT